jgi:cell division protein FtsZ
MSDELRVTVVATGIGKESKPDITLVTTSKPVQAVAQEKPAVAAEEPKPAPLSQQAPAAETNVQQPASSAAVKSKPQADHDYLDIPAFLRKQAD